MKALVLAAGLGTRLRPHTDHTPKPLFPLDGQPLLGRLLHDLAAAGIREAAVNTHHLHRQIESYLARGDWPLAVRTFHEPIILGTGGAIRNLGAFWQAGPLLVVNGDILSDIDYRALVAIHRRRGHPVTLAVHDRPEFNNVDVGPDAVVRGLRSPEPPSGRRLAFTGIQVVEPEILDWIPPRGFADSVPVYARMIAGGRKVAAWEVRGHRWEDIGTPRRYRAAAIGMMAPRAFARAWPREAGGKIERTALAGDGSDRRWYRLRRGRRSLVLADHGIGPAEGPCEARAFVAIGRHLARRRLPVPRIYRQDTFAGLVFVEDFGDRHLQDEARRCGDRDALARLYRRVIDVLVAFSVDGARGFDPRWAWQTPRYDPRMVYEQECGYFARAFVRDFRGLGPPGPALDAEFRHLSEQAPRLGFEGLMHRDFQSRNILVRGQEIGLIDFQGARTGPFQYDLASLLIDPYVDLPADLRDELVGYGSRKLAARGGPGTERFRHGYRYCALTRNLQILGAFAHLSRNRGKRRFEAWIPAAVRSLRAGLEMMPGEFPRLKALAAGL